MTILIFVTLFHLICAHESILSSGKHAYYDLNKSNLTTLLSAGEFAGLSFDSFMLINLGSVHYVANVTMKLHYNSKQFYHLNSTR